MKLLALALVIDDLIMFLLPLCEGFLKTDVDLLTGRVFIAELDCFFILIGVARVLLFAMKLPLSLSTDDFVYV